VGKGTHAWRSEIKNLIAPFLYKNLSLYTIHLTLFFYMIDLWNVLFYLNANW